MGFKLINSAIVECGVSIYGAEQKAGAPEWKGHVAGT